jgi:hypothetical protein
MVSQLEGLRQVWRVLISTFELGIPTHPHLAYTKIWIYGVFGGPHEMGD